MMNAPSPPLERTQTKTSEAKQSNATKKRLVTNHGHVIKCEYKNPKEANARTSYMHSSLTKNRKVKPPYQQTPCDKYKPENAKADVFQMPILYKGEEGRLKQNGSDDMRHK
jgi:hypothetical protein